MRTCARDAGSARTSGKSNCDSMLPAPRLGPAMPKFFVASPATTPVEPGSHSDTEGTESTEEKRVRSCSSVRSFSCAFCVLCAICDHQNLSGLGADTSRREVCYAFHLQAWAKVDDEAH